MTGAPNEELATFGAGCYWGTEKYIVTVLGDKYPGSILGNAVGFMSPYKDAVEAPAYKNVCSGTTTHVEVLHIRFNNSVISYQELVKFFFTFHDPTTLNKQGNDKGTQYASVIFYHSPQQQQIAQKVMKRVQIHLDHKEIKFANRKVITQILPKTIFYPAHLDH